MNIHKLLCLDFLNNAWTREFFFSFSFISSKKIVPQSSYSWGVFISSVDSYVSTSVSDFSKSSLLSISSITTFISSSLRIIGIMWNGI